MKIKLVVISTISLIFILIGLVFGLFEAKFCLSICETCSHDQLSPCYFIFLFVGIIFVACGASLLNDFRELIKLEQAKFNSKK